MLAPAPTSLRRSCGLLSCAIVVLVMSGCASAQHAASSASATVIPITEADFKITAPAHIAAGNVVFRVHNKGPDEHEFIIVPVIKGQLALRSDGFTLDEEAVQNSEPGSLIPGHPGVTRDLTVNLKPGHYVLLCNMSGHYLGGMHEDLVVA